MINGYDVLPFIPAVPLAQQPSALAYLKALDTQQRTALLQMPRVSSDLSEYGQKLLATELEHPYAPVAWRFKLLGDPGYSVQMAVRVELVQRELVAFEDPRIGRANVALMWPTEKGCQHLGIRRPEKPGKQDIAHHQACNWVRMRLESQGFDARCECPVPGEREHRADAGHLKDGKWHLYEIVYKCQANLVSSHLSACFLESRSVATVTVVAFTKTHLAELRRLVGAEPRLRPFDGRIQFEVIEPYMRELFG
jgi:hypothetical protein